MGSGNGFATFDVIADPVLLTKYNAMVHKAHQLRKAQVGRERGKGGREGEREGRKGGREKGRERRKEE